MTNPFEELELKFSARFDRIEQMFYVLSEKKPQEVQDRIGFKEAMSITGLKQSAVYKMTMDGRIPFKKFGSRLVFSRQELNSWMQERTVSKPNSEEIAIRHLAKEARKKIYKSK